MTGYFGHQREDVVEWLKTVRWEEGLRKVEEKVVRDTLACVTVRPLRGRVLTDRVLEKAGVVKPNESGWALDTFVRADVAQII